MGKRNQNAAGTANKINPTPNTGAGNAEEINTDGVEKKELTIDVDKVNDGETMEIENTMVTFKKEAKTGGSAGKTHGNNVAQVKRGLTVVREYTREIHGDEFEELAHQFASNHGGDVEVK